jgi:hypothetical protein
MAAKGWQRAFDDPIPLPGGRQRSKSHGGEIHFRQLRTLRDAADYITKLPKDEHDAPE